MTRYRISPSTYADLAEIYDFSERRWGRARADAYIHELFELFRRIAEGTVAARPAPAEYQVNLQFCVYESHHVYWRLGEEALIIAAVLHQSMDAPDRLRDASARPD